MPTPAPSRGTVLKLPARLLVRHNKSVKANSRKPVHISKHVTAKNVANSMKRFNAILKTRPATYIVKHNGGRKTRRNRRRA